MKCYVIRNKDVNEVKFNSVKNHVKEESCMQFKKLEWSDSISDSVLVASRCVVKVYDYMWIEFQINHNKQENRYYLHSFGKGSIRRLEHNMFEDVDDAKNYAYEIYSKELSRMKKAIDSFAV